ncbi:BamA/TamA family outer membrane protein [Myxococcota bacterium]|nr:BamA/TamA family outer membrane protein [Myxococcota bacterium]
MGRCARLFCVLWLALASPAGAKEDAEPVDPDAQTLQRIHWKGIHALTASQLENQMLSVPASWKFWVQPPPFDEFTLEEDVARIRNTYRDHGYYDAQIHASVTWNAAHTRATATVQVDEGEPVRLTQFQIEWTGAALPESKRQAIESGLPFETGEVFSVASYQRAREHLLTALANNSRPGAILSGGAEVNPERHSARVSWTVDPGPAVTFGAVTISGLETIDPQIVQRELTMQPGQPYVRSALVDSEKAIADLGLFRVVMVTAADPGNGAEIWPVQVQVEEGPPRRVQVAAGYGTQDKFRGRISWEHLNFLGDARQLKITGKASSLVLGVDTRIEQPHFPESRTRTTLYSSYLRETPPAYDSDLALAGVELERPFGKNWRGFAGYHFDYGDVSNVVGDTDREEGQTLLSYFRLAVQRSTLDQLSNPSRGTWLELSVEPAGKAIGSDVDYVRLTAEAKAFHPLWKVVLATRVLAGTIQTFGGSQPSDVPAFKLFYSGGSSSVRGFRYQHLGPIDAQGEPEGGLTLGQANFEIRFPIWKALSGVAFVDAGQVTRDPFDLRIDDFLASTGGGLRLLTPVGDIRLDYGHLLNPPANVDSGRFYVSVGQAF